MAQKTFKYSNGEITIVWKPDTCLHSTFCWKGLKAVFDPTRRPWIDPEGSTTERIIDQINKCPSGALSYFRNDDAVMSEFSTAAGAEESGIKTAPQDPPAEKGTALANKTEGNEEKQKATP